MATDIGSSYFSERARQSWRMLAYAGIAAPLLTSLHASASVVAFTAAACVVPSIWNFVWSQCERNGDKLPTLITHPSGREERRGFETHTFGDLIQKWRVELSFEDLVTEAAICSNAYGRRLAVIYLRNPGLPAAARPLLAELLRMHTRKTDEVKAVSKDEFLICAPLLRDSLDAEIIVKRLTDAIRNSDDLGLPRVQVWIGKAIYPMDGYTGADLIGQARLQRVPMASFVGANGRVD